MDGCDGGLRGCEGGHALRQRGRLAGSGAGKAELQTIPADSGSKLTLYCSSQELQATAGAGQEGGQALDGLRKAALGAIASWRPKLAFMDPDAVAAPGKGALGKGAL